MSLTLYHGDCLEVMKGLSEKSVDLFLCDLPFGCLTGGGGQEKKKRGEGNVVGGCSWDIKINLVNFWKQVDRLAKHDNVPVIHFCNMRFANELISSKPSYFRYELIWSKSRGTNFLKANKQPMTSHEIILIFAKKSAYYNRIDYKGNFKGWKAHDYESKCRTNVEASGKNIAVANDGSRRCVLSVIDIKKPIGRKNNHPTEKPMDIYKWLIERYCPLGGTVLDPTAGSGNSGFSAFELNRHAIMIEMKKEFHDKISKRMDEL